VEGVRVKIVPLAELAAERATGAAYENVSHSGDLAAVASAEVRVGIDIEVVDESRPWRRLAERCGWQVSSAAEFYERWTEYEAYAKALGLGLALNPGDVDLTGWRVERLDLPAGYEGCIVARRWT
jgi:phosphopantetheinyl transferase